MEILVLGSGAGGGSPQWNCACDVSQAVRDGDAPRRTQSSVAVSADGNQWFLLNASPDLGTQICDNAPLHPQEVPRHSPIKGVIVTNGDVDHVAGLLTLRESQPLALYGTTRVLNFLADNSIFNVLNKDYVTRRPLTLHQPFSLTDHDGNDSGLEVEAFAVSGKIALWLEDESKGDNLGTEEEDTIALVIRDANSDKRFFYIPACATVTDSLRQRLEGAALVFFDGTVWHDDEMAQAGVGTKTGQRMGHICNAGDSGAMASLAPCDIARKVFIHINTTNPILLPSSPERKQVEANGWEVANDGMHLTL